MFPLTHPNVQLYFNRKEGESHESVRIIVHNCFEQTELQHFSYPALHNGRVVSEVFSMEKSLAKTGIEYLIKKVPLRVEYKPE